MKLYETLLGIFVFLMDKVFDITKTFTKAYFRRVSASGLEIDGDIKMAELREGQQFNVEAAFRTLGGRPAAYEKGSVTWESSDSSIASVEAMADNELKAVVKGLDGSNNDSVIITFRADGDPDEDNVRELIATLDVVVTQGEAFVAELTAGAATDSEGGEPTPSPEPTPEPTPINPTPSEEEPIL